MGQTTRRKKQKAVEEAPPRRKREHWSTQPLPIEYAFQSVRKVFAPLLATLLERTKGDERNRIVFVSPDPSAGTTTLATSAALVLVRSFRTDVALIEANLYRPAMASYLGISASPGLLDVADGRAEAEQSVRNSLVDGLYVLAAGSGRQPEEGEIATPVVRELLDKTSHDHRYTLIDAPPVLEYPESTALLEQADKVILVTQAGRTRMKRAQHAIELIRAAGVPVSGIFINRYKPHRPFGLGRSQYE